MAASVRSSEASIPFGKSSSMRSLVSNAMAHHRGSGTSSASRASGRLGSRNSNDSSVTFGRSTSTGTGSTSTAATKSANMAKAAGELDVWIEVDALATEFVLQEGTLDEDAHEEASIPVEKLPQIVKRLLGFSVEDFRVADLLEKLGVASTSFIEFDVFVRFMHEVRPYAFEQDRYAGFDKLQVFELKRVFQKYCRNNDKMMELRTRELFDVLRELGAELNTVEQQEAMIEVIKEADKDLSGSTSFDEFLQIMRRITNERDIKKLNVDWVILRISGFSEKEVAEMRQIFDMFRDGGRFDLRSMRRMLETLGIKLSREEAVQLNKIMREESEDFPRIGYLNFPEYCKLMRRLIDSNFAGMRRKVDLVHHEAEPVAPKTSTGSGVTGAGNSARFATHQGVVTGTATSVNSQNRPASADPRFLTS